MWDRAKILADPRSIQSLSDDEADRRLDVLAEDAEFEREGMDEDRAAAEAAIDKYDQGGYDDE